MPPISVHAALLLAAAHHVMTKTTPLTIHQRHGHKVKLQNTYENIYKRTRRDCYTSFGAILQLLGLDWTLQSWQRALQTTPGAE